MEQVWKQIQDQDERITEIFRREEIDDIETFMALNEQDFKRLSMTTKMIKLIIKIQEQHRANFEPEEWIEEEIVLNASRNGYFIPKTEHVNSTNPYIEIDLEQIVNIDTVFGKTNEGLAIMEVLKENSRPNEMIIKKITMLLCDCLRSLFGCRPSNFYKNQISTSLVRTYSNLATKTGDVPQALWFHPHARGTNRHAGRIHYHMEYLARKSGAGDCKGEKSIPWIQKNPAE
ncbi:uncharacterized protein LOC135697046 [Ochlerotatus camptorhynchus]|uniref:uncharacterized protein LOC135697046 n=1 Tax=Ochlerotatus camptorhynchus TaxID=644619 RepID=UPI0031DE60C4